MGPLRLISNDGSMSQAGPSSIGPTANQDFIVTVTSLSTQTGPVASGPNLREPLAVTLLAVELPPMPEILRALLDSVRAKRGTTNDGHSTPDLVPNLSTIRNRQRNGDKMPEDQEETEEELWMRDPTLPLLFIRPWDGIGFHSGYALRCVLAAAATSPNIEGWSIHVIKVENLDHASSV